MNLTKYVDGISRVKREMGNSLNRLVRRCDIKYNKTALERRKTLGHLRSINRNMIIHFANQSQTCELLKKKKKFRTFHEKNLWKVVQSIPDWTDRENPYRLSYYIYIYVCVEFLA